LEARKNDLSSVECQLGEFERSLEFSRLWRRAANKVGVDNLVAVKICKNDQKQVGQSIYTASNMVEEIYCFVN